RDPPDYCKASSPLRSAQLYPLAGTATGFVQNARQITVYDPKTKKFSFIDTCFGTHHLNFAEDANNTLWLSNNSQGNLAVVGWINTKMYWETLDQEKSQGWTALIVDTNGNGKRDEGYNEPGRGAELGNKCPEGFSFYPIPGPGFQGDPGAAETPYYVWVDQHDILGLGANTPIATGNESDSLHALVGGRVIELRVPYPMGFFAKGLDGRIDDPNAGWKGRGVWVTSGN